MPKETFFNLPEEKRENITNIAIDEFANNDYADVSISRMVARAGIAKGSFYQYFEGKEDLYSYLLDLAVQKKWELLSLDHPDPQHMGVFRYLRWTAQAGVQFHLAYPELVKVAYRGFLHNAFPQEFQSRVQQESHKFYVHLVKIGKEQGDISPDIDEDLAAFTFNMTLSNLGQYILPRLTANEDYQQGKITFIEVPGVARIFDQAIDILERGLGNWQPAQKESSLEEQEVRA
ncbi:MAG: TetR/AcrR family transcriptional regulator [Caldilineaceae bacterium]|nr:TetR/AcrR family transcriptional regulator [Caldilineaceae bacterium]